MTSPGNPSKQENADLPGCDNFRDLGGHTASSGKTVRRRQVFRSGNLAGAKPDQVAKLHDLGIAAICDFRSAPEHIAQPNLWIVDSGIDYWRWGESVSVGDSLALLRECSVSEERTRDRMRKVYQQIPYEQAESFRELFNRLAARNTPLIFHCAAGKDRTGVAAALLLTILGVPRPVIFEDFLLTNRFFERIYNGFLSDPRHTEITSSNESAWLPMLRADCSYLDAMFAHIEAEHGGAEGYLKEVAGVDPGEQQAIRNHLLEDATR